MESTATWAREAVKGWLAVAGHSKYRIHAPNQVLQPATLRDGGRVTEFLRCNPHWGGVSRGDTANGLAEVITERMLERLTDRGGACVLYTHLGKFTNRAEPFGPPTRAALRRLASFQHRGRILVTTTRRLLDYCAAVRDLDVRMAQDESGWQIDIITRDDARERPLSLDGVTVYVIDPARTRVRVDGRDRTHLTVRNPPDETGRPSLSFRWPRLEFPRI
jgi:hypothetical protein